MDKKQQAIEKVQHDFDSVAEAYDLVEAVNKLIDYHNEALLKQEQPKPKITDVRMECLKCHRISTVGNAIPDIDGEGSLGCPFCYDKDLERVALVEQPPSDSEQALTAAYLKGVADGKEQPLSDSEQVFPKPLNPAQAAMMGIMPDCPVCHNMPDSEPSYNQAVERIQQLEAKLAEFRAYNEGDNAIVVIEQLEKELAEAKIVERIVVEYDTGLDATDKPYAFWDVFVEFKKPLLEIRPMIHWHKDFESAREYGIDTSRQLGVPCEIIEAKKTK